LPVVRGNFVPAIESTGRVKRSLDVLLHLESLNNATIDSLQELEQLRAYLKSFDPPHCSIRLLVPSNNRRILLTLRAMEIEVKPVAWSTSIERVPKDIAKALTEPLNGLLTTALNQDADCIVTADSGMLTYVEEFGQAGILLTSADFLLRYAETFVRGHDLPWAFARKAWFEPWMGLYQLSEPWTLKSGMDFLYLCQSKGVNRDAHELCRSLTYNRLGDLCFTRDRLCFYEIQQSVAKRAQWERQSFSTEIAYYLNFYYVLLYGVFDHAAALVNALFSIGIKERQVTARNPEFLKALDEKLSGVKAVFENSQHVDFIRRVAALRHTAAHRGAVTPTKVVKNLDHEPTNEELDQDIHDADLDYLLQIRPGPIRDGVREMLRSNARAARYERETLMEDVVLIEIDGKHGFIKPLQDTWWNFRRCLSFLNDVLTACSTVLR
jgi:hypothetical protein